MRKPTTLASFALLALLAVSPVQAQPKSSDADIAVQSARLETLRARAAMAPSSTTNTTLIEAESLLRQLRQASPDKRPALGAQLDAALGRLELEIDSASRNR
jgi:hypothetical protein